MRSHGVCEGPWSRDGLSRLPAGAAPTTRRVDQVPCLLRRGSGGAPHSRSVTRFRPRQGWAATSRTSPVCHGLNRRQETGATSGSAGAGDPTASRVARLACPALLRLEAPHESTVPDTRLTRNHEPSPDLGPTGISGSVMSSLCH